MSKTITYFTSSSVPTSAELAEIATINAIAASPYEVTVMCGKPKNKLTSICLSAAADNSYSDAGGSIEAGTISASSTDNSLNDSGNGFLTAGFQVGDVLTIAGFTGATANNTVGEAVVVSVTKAKMVLSGVTLTTDEAAETVTITSAGRFLTWGFKVGQEVMVRGFTTEANNISTGIITALTASKMTIGGTDGDGIADEVAGDTVTICSVESDATYGDVTITSDYVAGTIPPQYLDADGTPIGSLVVFDPANPPDVTALISTQAVISHGETVAVKTNGGNSSDNATATVVNHACTVALPATKTVVENSDTVTVDGATVTLAVGSGAVTGGTLAATKCVVSNGDTVAVGSDNVTITVSANAMASGSIGATKTIVENGDTLALTTAGTVTFGVSGGTLSGDVAATQAVVADGGTLTLGTDTITLGVADHTVTPSIPATKTIVEDTDTTTLQSKSIALAVESGALGVATFAEATDVAISNGAITTLEGKSISLAVETNTLGVATLTATDVDLIKNGDEVLTVAVTGEVGTASNTATFTVSGGKITAIALSGKVDA